MSSKKELNGHKICEALSQPVRADVLRRLIKNYPDKLTVSELQQMTVQPRMTVWFHINKLREAKLVELNGSKRGFRATTKALTIRFNGNGIHLKEEE